MLVPIGVFATIGMRWTLPPDNSLTKVRFDWTGFIALATALAAVQLVLARGVRLDWFDSTEIVVSNSTPRAITRLLFWVVQMFAA